MNSDFYVDNISSVTVEGPVVTVDFSRLVVDPSDKDKRVLDKRASITVTLQNFVQMVNMMNQTVKQMSDRSKEKNVKKKEPKSIKT